MSNELKPCPNLLCASGDIRTHRKGKVSNLVDMARCQNCGFTAKVSEWNNRSAESRIKTEAVREFCVTVDEAEGKPDDTGYMWDTEDVTAFGSQYDIKLENKK